LRPFHFTVLGAVKLGTFSVLSFIGRFRSSDLG